MRYYGDITKLKGSELPPVDVIVGGSPCQNLSVAGNRKGLEGSESRLFMEQIRVIKEMREHGRNSGSDRIFPRFAVWENVVGAFSCNGGRDFQAVLTAFVRIVEPEAPDVPMPDKGWPSFGLIMGDGWSLCYRVHDAQYWGVPQRRRRIALVMDLGGGRAGEVQTLVESVSGHHKPGKSTRHEAAAGAGMGTAVDGGEPVCIGFDGYNSAETGDVSATLGVNCGMSTGRNGVAYSLQIRSGCEGGGKGALVQEDKIACLTAAQTHTIFQPCQTVALEGNGQRASHKGDGYRETDKMYTLNTTEVHGVAYSLESMLQDDPNPGAESGTVISCETYHCQTEQELVGPLKALDYKDPGIVCYGISSYASNAMLSPNPNSGIYEADTSRTLDLNGGNPACNQGGMMVCEPVLYDMTHANDVVRECGSISPTLQNRMGTGGNQVPLTVEPRWIVRRLTPMECERLQGFPDGWSETGIMADGTEKQMSDSTRYKLQGNSIALPYWTFLMRRISAEFEHTPTLGSLFDGQGGFPLIWGRINGPESVLWSSEIDKNAEAVVRKHFGDEDTGLKGDFYEAIQKQFVRY
ncbi:MAG: DNA cytosine methyltransferase [Bacteroidales bacterium]|nr:DNA cytosine methyltransferase [Bacteroidales bacterium]